MNGKLQITTNRTEVCQYFAFFFDVAKPETHSELWQRLVKDFGPQRKQTKAFPEVHPANAFIGNVLRLELLSRYGLCQQLLDESLAYQLYMADRTGTLWENDGAYASCDHGFASHGGVHVLYRDVLGLQAGGYGQQDRPAPLHRLAPGLVRRAPADRGRPGGTPLAQGGRQAGLPGHRSRRLHHQDREPQRPASRAALNAPCRRMPAAHGGDERRRLLPHYAQVSEANPLARPSK